MRNKRGSLLIDVLLALFIISWMVELLYDALRLSVRYQNQPQKEDRIHEIFESAGRLYDD